MLRRMPDSEDDTGSEDDGDGSPSVRGQGPLRGRVRGGTAAEDALAESEAPLLPRVVRLGGHTVRTVRTGRQLLLTLARRQLRRSPRICTTHFVVQMCAHLYHAFLQLPFSGGLLLRVTEFILPPPHPSVKESDPPEGRFLRST